MIRHIFSRFFVTSCVFGLLAVYVLYDLPAQQTPLWQPVKEVAQQTAPSEKKRDALEHKKITKNDSAKKSKNDTNSSAVNSLPNLSPAQAKELQQLIEQNRNYQLGSVFDSFNEAVEDKSSKKKNQTGKGDKKKVADIESMDPLIVMAESKRKFQQQFGSVEIEDPIFRFVMSMLFDADKKIDEEQCRETIAPPTPTVENIEIVEPIYAPTRSAQVKALRDSARDLDLCADRLERENLYEQADGLRLHAQKLRLKARK